MFDREITWAIAYSMTCILLTSGRGPAECQRAVALMADYLQQNFPSIELADVEAGDERGSYKSAVLRLNGSELPASMYGSHVWICPSPYRPNHKRKRWYFGIEALPDPDALTLNLKDVRIDTFRASGAGGQHVNTTDSAVRATWVPEGLSVIASGERSQTRNKQIALMRLQRAVDHLQAERDGQSRKQAWGLHHELERGDANLTFKGTAFQLV